ncbi:MULTISPECIES: GntR family transcriptional regulator [Jeotgalibacillus]|uniref:GntR family transcriptional regulator n=1 Tax=Jeotgalibacillus haloalkalitolerans TaxID=3104292 RepID=A0ABU5KQ01_9BACL|nr:GntR family transcriptional regulator [Jeotgalibacillus sp. HH7-29]MDZ5713260.1 GntR family transcriptional regulator [Jeotgalibacillus sp. HH7-29]
MMLNADSTKPIYIQIAEWLETEILHERFKAHEKMFSQYQLADQFNINPATAAKGLTILADAGILYKKRGLGMFVTEEAAEQIRHRRINETLAALVSDVVAEAEHLNVKETDLIHMIQLEQSRRKGETS